MTWIRLTPLGEPANVQGVRSVGDRYCLKECVQYHDSIHPSCVAEPHWLTKDEVMNLAMQVPEMKELVITARETYAHLAWLDTHGSLTDEETPYLRRLDKTLTPLEELI